MKKLKNKLLFSLVLLSLVSITAVVTLGAIRERTIRKKANIDISKVLGESADSMLDSENKQKIDNVIQNTVKNTKETVSQKVIEVEKTISNTLEKEITNLTQSQIETLKIKVCQDWGVITASSTKTP